MTNKWLIRSEPVRVSRGFDRLFEDVWGSFLANGQRAGVSSRTLPAMNIWEDGDKFVAELEVPGMKIGELEMLVKGDELSIKGERQVEETKEGVTYLRRERVNRSVQGTVRLPAEVDVEKVEARLEDGILNVTLPKAEKAKARSVQIRAN